VPGAVLWSVWGDLLGPDERLIDDPAALGQLLSRSGVSPETTIVVYGDLFNWGATLAF
jgi:thiosulfate/3-mercaptopyruvate sulfurtransferase